MAMTSTLVPSPTLKSAFSPYTDSPSSPAPYTVAYRSMQRHSGNSDSSSLQPPPSPYPATVDPSPVESNNSTSTDATDIDAEHNADDAQEDLKSPDIEILSPASGLSNEVSSNRSVRIDTNVGKRLSGPDDGPQSVIHAPAGFKSFNNNLPAPKESPRSPPPSARQHENKRSPPLHRTRSTSSPSSASEHTIVSSNIDKRASTKDTAPINTQIPLNRHGAGSTPRASTKQEADEEFSKRSQAGTDSDVDKSESETTESRTSTAEFYTDEGDESAEQNMGTALRDLNSAEEEISTLKAALSECWTLCNTLAGLSSSHRERMFNFSGSGNMQEQAWKSCWRLCQKLYESRDEDHASQVLPTLELCRDFCQALFEARVRGDEVTDSILRVSFELNNHLYNTHDRNLPDAFRERTLDFYLTMCHRLMKQRTSLPEETDALLRACWSLAEMLFSLRQNNRDNKPVDEELLGSAVQACWELCDLFREGWTQIRPERGTPRPVQRIFPTANFGAVGVGMGVTSGVVGALPSYAQSQTGTSRPASSLSREGTYHSAQEQQHHQHPPLAQHYHQQHQQHSRTHLMASNPRAMFVPETPTTIFDDRDDLSPGEGHQVPNIMVLGPADGGSVSSSSVVGVAGRQPPPTPHRWTSNGSVTGASSMSSYSDASQRTIGSATTPRAVNSASQSGAGGGMGSRQTSPKSMSGSINGGDGGGVTANRQNGTDSPEDHGSGQDGQSEDPQLVRLKALVIKALRNTGYPLKNPPSPSAFVRTLPPTAFGSQPWQVSLFERTRKLVVTDLTLRDFGALPFGRHFSTNEIARATASIGRNEGYAWFGDLFRWVFGYGTEEAVGVRNMMFVV